MNIVNCSLTKEQSQYNEEKIGFTTNGAETIRHHAETPILWPAHGKSLLIGKDFDAGRDWGQAEKGTTEDEMAGWHH